MDQIYKQTPLRLPVIFQSSDAPLYLVTFATLLRRSLLADAAVHDAFRTCAIRGRDFGAVTGRYVLMPDHVHVFVRITSEMTLSRWVGGLKQMLGKAIVSLGHEPTRIHESRLRSFWQPGFFDRLLRHDESYEQKWEYVVQNPVRAGLVKQSADWLFQGEIEVIARV